MASMLFNNEKLAAAQIPCAGAKSQRSKKSVSGRGQEMLKGILDAEWGDKCMLGAKAENLTGTKNSFQGEDEVI